MAKQPLQIEDFVAEGNSPFLRWATWGSRALGRLPLLDRLIKYLAERDSQDAGRRAQLERMAYDPVGMIKSVAQAHAYEKLASLYAYALQCCIEQNLWRCWGAVFRLDTIPTDAERAAAIRSFSQRWVLVEGNDVSRMQKIDDILERECGFWQPANDVTDTNPHSQIVKAAKADLENWTDLIRALFVLNFYETSDYGGDNFGSVICAARVLLDSVSASENTMTAEQRAIIIRYAIHFDYIERAIVLAERGGAATEFERQLLEQFRSCTKVNALRAAEIQKLHPARPKSIIGTVVWGDRFIANFMEFHVPSLLAPGNIPALAKNGYVVCSIVTTEQGKQQICSHPLFRSLEQHAQVVFSCFDEEMVAQRQERDFNFYRFYGMLDHINVDLARQMGADLFLIPPDVICSARMLSAIHTAIATGMECCGLQAIEANVAALLPAIERSRSDDGILIMEERALMRLAAQNATEYYRSLILSPSNTNASNHPREVVWQAEDGLITHTLYSHPIGISARALAHPFHPNYENVDYALAPRLLQKQGEIEILKARDAFIAHFSDPMDRGGYTGRAFSLRHFLRASQHAYAAHRRCFRRKCFIPCGTIGYPVSATYQDDIAIIMAGLDRPIFGVYPYSPEDPRS